MATQTDLMGLGMHSALAAKVGLIKATPAGAGTTQATGTVLMANSLNVVTSITAASLEAFTLPTANTGDVVVFSNQHATAAAKIFPATGGAIAPGGGNAVGATNAVFSLVALSNAVLFAVSATQWIVISHA